MPDLSPDRWGCVAATTTDAHKHSTLISRGASGPEINVFQVQKVLPEAAHKTALTSCGSWGFSLTL